MSWRVLKINAYWTAEEAETVLTFIDELRDQILEHYEQDIITMRIQALEEQEQHSRQRSLPLELPDDF